MELARKVVGLLVLANGAWTTIVIISAAD